MRQSRHKVFEVAEILKPISPKLPEPAASAILNATDAAAVAHVTATAPKLKAPAAAAAPRKPSITL